MALCQRDTKVEQTEMKYSGLQSIPPNNSEILFIQAILLDVDPTTNEGIKVNFNCKSFLGILIFLFGLNFTSMNNCGQLQQWSKLFPNSQIPGAQIQTSKWDMKWPS